MREKHAPDDMLTAAYALKTYSLTFDDFQKLNKERRVDKFESKRRNNNRSKWTLGDWGNAMAGEAGEACNVIKKYRRGDFELNDKIKIKNKIVTVRTAIMHEIADMMTYGDAIISLLGGNTGDVMREKFNEVSAREGYKKRI